MKLNKKAFEVDPKAALVAIILLLFVLGFGFYMLGKTGKLGGELLGIAPASSIICAQTLGVKTPDIDNDGLKDTCDNCVCAPPKKCRNPEYDFSNPLSPTIINKRDDSDQDGLPDACDENDNDATKKDFNSICKKQVKASKTGTCYPDKS